MNNLSWSSIERKIAQISEVDKIIRVHARVRQRNPFIIEDETGKAFVKTQCTFREGDRIRVIGYVSLKRQGELPEIDPIAVQDMSKFDYSLYDELQRVKSDTRIGQPHGK